MATGSDITIEQAMSMMEARLTEVSAIVDAESGGRDWVAKGSSSTVTCLPDGVVPLDGPEGTYGAYMPRWVGKPLNTADFDTVIERVSEHLSGFGFAEPTAIPTADDRAIDVKWAGPLGEVYLGSQGATVLTGIVSCHGDGGT